MSVMHSGAADVRAWTFDELVHEGLSRIPAHAPQWTDHNPSDPGITLIELLAYYSEILAYRALRITPDARLNFLRLLGPPQAEDQAPAALEGGPVQKLDEAIRRRLAELAQEGCAATPADVERMAADAAQKFLSSQSGGGVGKVRCVCIVGDELRQLRAGQRVDPQAAGDMCAVLAPEVELPRERMDALCREVQAALASRCLLTSRIHVMPPVSVQLGVGASIALRLGASADTVLDAVEGALRERFAPAFGRLVHLSEILEVIDRQEGVDFVEDLVVHRLGIRDDARMGVRPGVYATLGHDARFGGGAGRSRVRLLRSADGEVATVLPRAWEIAEVRLMRDKVKVFTGEGHDG